MLDAGQSCLGTMFSGRGSGTHHKYRSKEPLPLAATQREGAIQNDAGPLLIAAGAGTGKTEVLVAGCLKLEVTVSVASFPTETIRQAVSDCVGETFPPKRRLKQSDT